MNVVAMSKVEAKKSKTQSGGRLKRKKTRQMYRKTTKKQDSILRGGQAFNAPAMFSTNAALAKQKSVSARRMDQAKDTFLQQYGSEIFLMYNRVKKHQC